MTITGTVENIIFRNDENYYTVLELETDDIPVVATGIFPSIVEGETIEAVGEYHETKYGMQFAVSGYTSVGFRDLKAVANFLASGLFKGIGAITAQKITKEFGNDTFEVIANNPSELTKIKGITPKRALQISEAYKDVVALKETVIYLTEKGISLSISLKIFEVYKNHTISIVNKNPYKLVEDIDGIGFKTADDIAKKLGIDSESDFRARAGFIYILKEFAEKDGSTCLPYELMVNKGTTILGFDYDSLKDKFDKVISDLLQDGKIRVFEIDDVKMIALSYYYYMERKLASSLMDINANGKEVFTDLDYEISEFEKQENISLHEKQKEAVKIAVENGLSIITGGPGTGKTTIIKCIIYILKRAGLDIALVAPTGRAAKRLEEATNEKASTIHRLLDLDFTNGKGYFTFNEETKLKEDVIICDEVSMTDCYVMNSLLSAVKLGGKVVLVGDKDQLPSVGAGNVLKDILGSDIFSVATLTEVYRQGKESFIITNAHKINNGEMPNLDVKDNDFFWSSVSVPKQMQERIVEMATNTLPKFTNVSPKGIQVLTPMKKGMCGTNELNTLLQEKINPKDKSKAEFSVGDSLFREGDKVMQTVNNYKLEWMRVEDGFVTRGEGVFNGDIGEIIEIDTENSEVVVLFEDGRNAVYDKTDLGDLMLSYAITIHKSQGSEFDVVIIPITGGSPALYTRNLLYTAVTRAKKLVVLMGEKTSIYRMVKNNYIEKRYTMLKEFLIGYEF